MALTTPPRKRGRPRSVDEKTTLTTWVSVRCYDTIASMARRRDVSVSALVRRVLERAALPPSQKQRG